MKNAEVSVPNVHVMDFVILMKIDFGVMKSDSENSSMKQVYQKRTACCIHGVYVKWLVDRVVFLYPTVPLFPTASGEKHVRFESWTAGVLSQACLGTVY